MPPYNYSPLSKESDNIRLLRLLPSKVEGAEIKGELLEHCLQETSRSSYEAVSYVWGCADTIRSVFIGDEHLGVTLNLYTALLHIRDASFPRIVWIDAICINQADEEEKEHQIQLMANIYGRATRVIVWLGETMDNSDEALESIRAAGMKPMNDSGCQSVEQKVTSLLQREWFQRIWVLQEVAAARHVLIMCGTTEIDGNAFCLGLEQFEDIHSSLPTQVRAVTYLIRGAVFRPKLAIRSSERASLNISTLGELVDMYHAHEATQRHDKIYALLGMASDDIKESGLFPDYTIAWNELLRRLVRFLLGEQLRIKTWNDKEEVEIYGNGHLLGNVDQVTNHLDGRQTIYIDYFENENFEGYNKDGLQWNIQAMANDVQKNDLVYLFEGASKPSILRVHGHWLRVIMIVATLPTILRSQTFQDSFPVVWNWGRFSWNSQRKGPDAAEGPHSPWLGACVLKDLKDSKGAITELSRTIQWSLEEDYATQIPEEDLSAIVIRFDSRVVSELFDRMGHKIQITEQVLEDIVRFHNKGLVARVLGERRDEVRITDAVVMAAAENTVVGSEVMALLFDWTRHDATIQISEALLVTAARNCIYGREMIYLLLDRGGNGRLNITEAVFVATAKNSGCKAFVMERLLDYEKGKPRDVEEILTEAVLVAAAANVCHGLELMEFMLDQGQVELNVTEAVVTAALKNGERYRDLMLFLFRKSYKAVSIYESMGGKLGDFYS